MEQNSSVLLQKLEVILLVAKIPTFYGSQRLITALKTSRNWPHSWATDEFSLQLLDL